MGKGDRKTTKGKRSSSSYGNARPHRVAVDGPATAAAAAAPPAAPAKASAARKTAAKKKA